LERLEYEPTDETDDADEASEKVESSDPVLP